ncbi:hypothetical protein V6N13_047718 [Hibiscus sabdariffa]|uniref:3'-5' exonuclease domain-containing protein n=1 Tax=Hibiscus sabdariffa TaxID=183260 RepID=A0ABR2F519_9ROSI
MDWDCDSGYPINHYLFAFPVEGKYREKVFDPFRSIAFSLRFDVSLKQMQSDSSVNEPHCKAEVASPTVSFSVHDLAWLAKFGNLMALPPYKIRLFAGFPRFAVQRIPRSGNLPLDRVMTKTMFRSDISLTCIKYKTFVEDDPVKGLTFTTTKFKVEVCSSKGKQNFTYLVYLGLDLHFLKVKLFSLHPWSKFLVKKNPSSSIEPPPAATLQLCIGHHCLIFQLVHANDVPLSLRRFLDDARNTFVGVWNYTDKAKLRRSKHGLQVHRVVERNGLRKQMSMEKLAEIILGADGVKKPKRIAPSAWDTYRLSSEQVQYACVSFELGKALKVWNQEED